MIFPNRDLLVLTKKVTTNPDDLEQEVKLLNGLLFHVENMKAFCIANEVIDINRYRLIQKQQLVKQIVRSKHLKPFVFICNKN